MKPPPLRPLLPQSAIRRRILPIPSRSYALQAPSPPMLQVFNDNVKHLQQERAARDVEASRRVDYLRDEVASRLCERLLVPSIREPPRSSLNITTRISNGISPTSLTLAQMPATSLAPLPILQLTRHHFRREFPT